MDEPPGVPQSAATDRGAVAGDLDRMIADGLADLRATVMAQQENLWLGCAVCGLECRSCDARTGALGVLATLNRATRVLDDPTLRDALASVSARIDQRWDRFPEQAVDAGRSHTVWALHDAARLLGDSTLAARAREVAGALPTAGADPSACRGLAGAGLAHLYLWQQAGDPALWQTVLGYADAVLAAADRADETAWTWPIGPGADSPLAGGRRYGFAHGVAGVGTFLVEVAAAAGPDNPATAPLLDAALRAGETVIDAARTDARGNTCWPLEAGGGIGVTESACGDGPAGIGEFLIRLWGLTDWPRACELAQEAAETIIANLRPAHADAGCALAATGHFLIDLAEFTGEDRYRARAENVAAAVVEAPAHPSVGTLDFLLRLRHGGPPPWLPPPRRSVETARGRMFTAPLAYRSTAPRPEP